MNTADIIARLQRHLTLNNAVLGVAILIVFASIWNTMLTLQKNFLLQQRVNVLEQEIKVTQLEVETLRLQQQYLRSAEYQELTARAKLGKVAPGEQVINLPPLSKVTKPVVRVQSIDTLSNFDKWMRFFFGG